MKQKFEQVTGYQHLYKRQYKLAGGGWKTIYYARFVCRLKGKRRHFSLGSDFTTAKEELTVLQARNIRREDFDLDKAPRVPDRMTVEKWSRIYKELEEIKAKQSFDRDCDYINELNLFFGAMFLTGLKCEHLFQYRKKRLEEYIIRNGRPAKTKVSPGTIANEFSCFRHMLRIAARENLEVSIPSFDGLIVRNQGRERVLDADEEKALLDAYPQWLKRVSIVARETCLSQGDIIRLTKDMIDRKNRVIVPEGGRVKTGVKQAAPLTDVALEVLDEIEKDKKRARKKGRRQRFPLSRLQAHRKDQLVSPEHSR